MNTARYGHSAVTNGHYIYVIGGHTGYEVLSSVERAIIDTDGSLGSWEYMIPMNTARYYPAVVVAGDYVYAIGGVAPDGVLASVERAMINADGSLSSWQTTSALTMARYGHAAVVVGNYIYAIAGSGEYSTLTSVERAVINVDGSLSPWEAVTSITDPISLHAVLACSAKRVLCFADWSA